MQTILSALPAILLSLLRHGLTAAGLSGILTDQAETELLGAFAILIGLIWSVVRAVKVKREDAAEAASKASVVAIFLIGTAAFLVTGCGNTRATRRIVSVKHTVLGIDVAQSMNSAMPAFRIGLVRSFWQEVPVETNALHAPEYVASTVADVKLTHQQVNEDTATGARGVRALGEVLTPATHAPANPTNTPPPTKPAPAPLTTNTPPAAPAPVPAPAAPPPPGSLRIPPGR